MNIREQDLGLLRTFWRLMLAIIFLGAGIWKTFILTPMGHVQQFFLNPNKPEYNFSNLFPEWSLVGLGVVIPIIELIVGTLLLLGYQTRLALQIIAALLLCVLVGHLLKEPLFSPLNHIFLRGLIASFIWVLPAKADRLSLERTRMKAEG